MVDFKYHVVSIVAVFLALAVGIVLGTNVLSGDVLKNLKTQTSDLRKEAQDLRAQNQTQQNQLSDDEHFAEAVEPTVVAGRLQGSRVVVVSVPDAPKSVRDKAVKTLTEAGAVVTSQVALDATYVDPTQATALSELLKSFDTRAFDPAGGVAARAATALAEALVGDSRPSATPPAGARAGSPTPAGPAPVTPVAQATATPTPALTPAESIPPVAPTPPSAGDPTQAATAPGSAPRYLDAASTEVLAGLQKAGFISFDQQPTTYADIIVVVAPAAPQKPAKATATPTPSPDPDTALLDLVAAFQRAGSNTIVVGPAGSADPGGLLSALRANDSLAKVVSGIDNIDAASGRIAMVFALGAGVIGQYGSGQGAQGPLPTVSTSASSTPGASTPTAKSAATSAAVAANPRTRV